jgi:RHS repeat-associated protein
VPDFMVKNGETFRIVSDQTGSVRLVVNAQTGEVAQRIDYDEFGRITHNTNPGFQPFGFGGGLYDEDTQLTHFGAREYDAFAGRWTSQDPAGFVSGNNLHAYAGNDPVNFGDPSGLAPCDCSQNLLTTLGHGLFSDPQYGVKDNTVHPYFAPDFAAKLGDAILILNFWGVLPLSTDGYRTKAEQEKAFANAEIQRNPACNPAKSVCKHQLGYSVDFHVYDLVGRGEEQHRVYTADYPQIKRIMQSLHIEWGGSFKDDVHFYIEPGGAGGQAGLDRVKQVEDYFTKCLTKGK